ncbi:MAG: hypothetical protein U0797_04325 [Gemmataceae bacterium]
MMVTLTGTQTPVLPGAEQEAVLGVEDGRLGGSPLGGANLPPPAGERNG